MDTTTASTPTAGGRDAAPGGAPRGAMSLLGWLELRDCALGGDGPRVGLALLHPGVGVAFVESGPEDTGAAERFRRALDARRFPAIFGGYPPIVRAVLPAGRPAELDRALFAAFEAQPPLALAGGDAWVGTARAAIEAEQPVAVPERLRARHRRARSPWRRAGAALAVAGCASAAALAVVYALPGHSPEPVATAAAPGVAAVDPRAAASADDAPPAPVAAAAVPSGQAAAMDVAKAQTESGSAAAAAAAAEAERFEPAPTAADAGLARRDEPAPPEAAPEPRAPADGAEGAAGPQEAGGAPAAPTPTASEERPRPGSAASPPPAAVPGSDPAPGAARPAASTEPQPPTKRAPAPSAPAPPAGGDRRAPSAAAPAPAPAGDAGRVAARCREILVRATMGEALSDNDRERLRRGCQPRN